MRGDPENLWRCGCGRIAVYFALGVALDPIPLCYTGGRDSLRDPTRPSYVRIVPITIDHSATNRRF